MPKYCAIALEAKICHEVKQSGASCLVDKDMVVERLCSDSLKRVFLGCLQVQRAACDPMWMTCAVLAGPGGSGGSLREGPP